MRIVRRFFVFILISASLTASGQYTKEFKRLFHDASYLLETGFYEEAYNRYKNLLILDPGNCNILFHCGVCCLSIQGLELEALAHLKKAVKCSTPDYRNNAPDESRSPILTYFMLGKAYHLNYEFDQAVDNYNNFLEFEGDEDPLQIDFTRLQIAACIRADSLMDQPPSFEFQNVLDHFDEYLPSCSNPVISGDGNTLIFLVDYSSDKKIMITKRKGEFWTKPEVINNEIGMVGETYPVSLSYDGMDLYLAHAYYSHSDILVSTFEEGAWSKAKALGGNINGRTSETHASISKDGTTLYFTSDVRGGMGSMDIYVSTLNEKGEWGVPTNLGPVINTKYEEHTPFISSNDSILFFSSQGHASMGGVDVFYSKLGADGAWGEPVSLGAPVNTTGEDLFFNPGWSELDGVYAVRKEDDPSSKAINMVIELDFEEQAATVKTRDTVETETAPVVISPKVVTKRDTIFVPVKEEVTELFTSIPFDHNKFSLSTEASLEVKILLELLLDYPKAELTLMGHTDATGPSEYNMLLSMQRADQIAQNLEGKGVSSQRIHLEGKGEDSPIALDKSTDGRVSRLGRYLNRHVIAIITGESLPNDQRLSGLYVPRSLRNNEGSGKAAPARSYTFSVQVKASLEPLDRRELKGLNEVKEYICKDGYHRYAHGEFPDFVTAKEHLDELKEKGFDDAFIQTMEYYKRAMKK